VEEVAGDAFRLADRLGWARFHVVGHSMTGMAVQRMAVDDWTSGAKRLKSVVAITPVTADGYPADNATRKFLWDLIHRRELSEQGFFMLPDSGSRRPGGA
jgi:pimeloyl-ACP methyl ester carboxylesterase